MSETGVLIHPRDRHALPLEREAGPPFTPKTGDWRTRELGPARARSRMPRELVVEVSPEEILVQGTRIPLECVVYAQRSGSSVEEIAAAYPSLTPARIHSLLGYCLEDRALIDAYLARAEAYRERSRRERAADPSPLLARLKIPAPPTSSSGESSTRA